MTPEQSRDQVRQELTDMWAHLKPNGLRVHNVSGEYTTCVDQGGWVMYTTLGRFDPTPEAPKRPIVDKLVQPLTAAGWTVTSLTLDTVERRILRAKKGELHLELNEYRSRPFLLWDIIGHCIEVGKDHDSQYLTAGGELISLS